MTHTRSGKVFATGAKKPLGRSVREADGQGDIDENVTVLKRTLTGS